MQVEIHVVEQHYQGTFKYNTLELLEERTIYAADFCYKSLLIYSKESISISFEKKLIARAEPYLWFLRLSSNANFQMFSFLSQPRK